MRRALFCKTLMAAAAAAALLAGPAPAQAQSGAASYPSRPITLIVNGGPGSLPDLFARPLAEQLRAALKQAVVVENKPGAGGMVAMQTLKNQPADGHTLAFITNAHAVWNPYVFPKLSYDPATDLKPVSPVAVLPMAVVVSGKLPVNSLAELFALAKQQPGRLNYASSGNGSPPHVLFEMLRHQAGVDIVHVPFKTGTDAMTSVVAGDTQVYMAGTALVEPMVRDGRLKVLAVSPHLDNPVFAQAPTLQQAGFDGYESAVWLGVVTRSGVPSAVVDRLNAVIGQALQQPDIVKLFDSHGSVAYHDSPASFAQRITDERATWGPMIKQLGIAPD